MPSGSRSPLPAGNALRVVKAGLTARRPFDRVDIMAGRMGMYQVGSSREVGAARKYSGPF